MLVTYAGSLPRMPDMIDFILVPDHGSRCDAARMAAAVSKIWKQSIPSAGIAPDTETRGTRPATGVKDGDTRVDDHSPHALRTASRFPAPSTGPLIPVQCRGLRTRRAAFEKAPARPAAPRRHLARVTA